MKEELIERIEEFKKDGSIEEFANILEVIDVVADYKKFDRSEVENLKKEESGRKRKILKT